MLRKNWTLEGWNCLFHRYLNIYMIIKLRDHILIYFTDGMGEEKLKVKPINCKTLWVLTGAEETLSLREPFGEIKKLSGKKLKE